MFVYLSLCCLTSPFFSTIVGIENTPVSSCGARQAPALQRNTQHIMYIIENPTSNIHLPGAEKNKHPTTFNFSDNRFSFLRLTDCDQPVSVNRPGYGNGYPTRSQLKILLKYCARSPRREIDIPMWINHRELGRFYSKEHSTTANAIITFSR